MLIFDLLVFIIITFSLIYSGLYFEKKASLPTGFGPIVLFLGIQQIFSLFSLNPWGSKNLWIFQTLAIWSVLVLLTVIQLFKKTQSTVSISRTLVSTGIGALLVFFLQPGERTWDGAGYHNLISLLIFQTGELWNWPNLMWAQWFPAGQETVAASFLVVFSGYNGLIVPTRNWVLVIVNLIEVNLQFRGFEKKKFVLSILFVAIVPFLLAQTGSAYVDIQTGVTFMVLCYMLTLTRKGLLNTISLGIAAAGLASSKWSGVAFIMILILFCLTHRNFSLSKRVKDSLVICGGALCGIFPVIARNIFEFGSPTYPFKGPFNIWPGLFPQSLMTNQIGVANQPPIFKELNRIEVIIYEYFVSIFNYSNLLFSSVKQNGFNFNLYDPALVNYFSYDARLGGFGIVFTTLLVIAIYMNRNNFTALVRFSLLLSPLVFFPMNWWARYFIGIPMAILLIERDNLLHFFQAKKYRRSIGIFLLSVVATLNLMSFLAYSYLQKISWPSPNGYGGKISELVSSECRQILVVGEGLTFSSALWGENKCNRVVGSIHFGNSQESLGQFGSVPTLNPISIMGEVKEYLKMHPSLLIVLTYSDSEKPIWATNMLAELLEMKKLDNVLETTESNGHPIVLIQTKI